MKHFVLAALSFAMMPAALWGLQPSVQVKPPDVHGSRPVEPTTGTAVVRDYLQSWQSMRTALDENQVGALDPDFVGTARTRLAHTIEQQAAIGIHTRYQDESHHLQIVFYSPNGLSIQLVDNVTYNEEVFDSKSQALASHRIHARYLVVLTPAANRWQVRILQASPQS